MGWAAACDSEMVLGGSMLALSAPAGNERGCGSCACVGSGWVWLGQRSQWQSVRRDDEGGHCQQRGLESGATAPGQWSLAAVVEFAPATR